MDRPNIVLISVDELHYAALSCVGNKYVHTPNIDSIFERGVSFDTAYCTNPVCSPARSSWATGLYTSENGASTNFSCLMDSISDIGQLLNTGGYFAAHAGKWHVDGRDPRKSFHCLYYGNDEISAYGAEVFDCATTHAALPFLESYTHSEPFYLQLGYINPHDICEYMHNHEYKKVPSNEDLLSGMEGKNSPCLQPDYANCPINLLPPLPENFGIIPNETRVMKVFRREPDALIHEGIRQAVSNWTELDWRYFIWNYYRYVEKVDVEIGKVLNALEGSQFSDNTVILFTADHGEGLGCHSMFQKFTLYEESIRVPFVLSDLSGRFISKKGTISHCPVSGIDVFGTICDYAQLPCLTNARSVRLFVDEKKPNRAILFTLRTTIGGAQYEKGATS